MQLLQRLRIVMINTSDSGNIGAAARAMKTMGLSQLVLVQPKEFPTAKATARASGAADILVNARVVDSLDEAAGDCQLVLGASARVRTLRTSLVTPREAASRVLAEPEGADIAILFGREDAGLTNEELHRCHLHICIPCNEDYPVLNVAAAAQVICYEMRMAALEQLAAAEVQPNPDGLRDWDQPLTTIEETEQLLQHLEQVLLDIDFFDPRNPKLMFARLRRLFLRTRIDRLEMNMLRGILATVQKRVRREPGMHS